MATVLVTGVGGASGVGAVRSLHAETSHEVVGVDMNPMAAGLELVDAGRTVPAASDEDWPGAMAAIVEEFDADVILPTVDEELARLRSLVRELPDVPVVAPRQGVIDLALDKYRASMRLQEWGHEVPQTWLGREADDIDESAYPLVVKPRRGRGSRGVQRVADRDELAAYLDATAYAPDELLCQEFVDGTEYTTSVVATTDNRLLGVVPKEAIRKEGSTVVGATREAPAVEASCRDIFETLQPAGPINVQQMVADDGTPYTIEINPRFSSTSCLTVDAGVDEFDLLVRDALGDAVEPAGSYEPDRYILRYDDHVFVDEETIEERS